MLCEPCLTCTTGLDNIVSTVVIDAGGGRDQTGWEIEMPVRCMTSLGNRHTPLQARSTKATSETRTASSRRSSQAKAGSGICSLFILLSCDFRPSRVRGQATQ